MIALTGYSLTYYLVSRQIVTRDEFFEGTCLVKESYFEPTRNNNFVVNRVSNPPLFIKQPRSFNIVEGGLGREIRFYQKFGDSLANAEVGLRPHSYDEENQILIFDFMLESFPYTDLIIRRCLGPAGEELTRVAGQQVSVAHSLTIRSKLTARHPFQTMMPWMLTAQDTAIKQIAASDDVRIARLGRTLLNYRSLLDRLAVDWNVSHVIHGDLSWSNLLVTDSSLTNPHLRLTDWEFAALGDPLWDMATLTADYLVQSTITSGQIPCYRLPVLLKTLLTAYTSKPADWQRIIRLTGLAAFQRYYNWLLTQTLPPLVKSEDLFSQAIIYFAEPDVVLKAWEIV